MPTHFATIKERGLWPSSTAFWIKTREGYAMPCQGASPGAAPVLNWKTGKTLRAEAWLSMFPNKNNSTLQEYTSRTQTFVSVEQATVHVFAGPRKRYCNDCNIEREKIVWARCALFWEVVFGGYVFFCPRRCPRYNHRWVSDPSRRCWSWNAPVPSLTCLAKTGQRLVERSPEMFQRKATTLHVDSRSRAMLWVLTREVDQTLLLDVGTKIICHLLSALLLLLLYFVTFAPSQPSAREPGNMTISFRKLHAPHIDGMSFLIEFSMCSALYVSHWTDSDVCPSAQLKNIWQLTMIDNLQAKWY